MKLDRRAFVGGALGLGAAGLFPAWAMSGSAGLAPDMSTLTGEAIALRVGHSPFTVGGRTGHAITLNGTLPAPLIRLREGQNVRIHVTNALEEDTSIHWHGLLLPFQMDGVPGVTFRGIDATLTAGVASRAAAALLGIGFFVRFLRGQEIGQGAMSHDLDRRVLGAALILEEPVRVRVRARSIDARSWRSAELTSLDSEIQFTAVTSGYERPMLARARRDGRRLGDDLVGLVTGHRVLRLP